MSMRIPLTQNRYAEIDDEDFDLVGDVKWYAAKNGHTFYAVRRTDDGHTEYMHRRLMGDPQCNVDHRDRNGLNNRRSNLRLGTQSDNLGNARRYSNNSSGYRGVTWHSKARKWFAQITRRKCRASLGLYSSRIDAARAYDHAAKILYGNFSNPNFKDESESDTRSLIDDYISVLENPLTSKILTLVEMENQSRTGKGGQNEDTPAL